MFIKPIKKKNNNSKRIYYSHKLVETVRTQNGPRHKTVLQLGTLNLPKEKWKTLANRIEEIYHGIQRLVPPEKKIENLARYYVRLLIEQKKAEQEQSKEKEQDFQSVDLSSVSSSHAKSVGPEHIGLQAMKQLGLFTLFKNLGFNQNQINISALSIVGRLVHPSSENELKRYAREESALDELLGTDFSYIGQNALYDISDLLYKHKDDIERFLRKNTRDLLGLEDSIILYDLTNTHFEGDLKYVDKAKHGPSKQKRNDRPLITVGFVLDHQGFLKTSNVFEGNVGEPSTLMQMVRTLHSQNKGHLAVVKPTVVLDAGIASQDNLKLLVEQGFSYLVVSRSRPQDIPPDQEFQEIKQGIKVNSFTSGEEVYLHCLSEDKMQKEQAMLNRSKQGMENELSYLKQGLGIKGRLKDYSRIQQRIGKLRKQYSRASQAFDIRVYQNGNQAADITWSFDESKLSKPYDGSYFLRTNRSDLDAKTLWQIYVMLTTVEDSFKCLKSELGLRPNFHNRANRVEGHIFITILAYHLLQWIHYHLSKADMSHRWSTIRSWVSTQRVITTSLPREEGGAAYIRHCTSPTLRQSEIYSALGISRMPLKPRKTITQ